MCDEVTDYKEKYYLEKQMHIPHIKSAFITFRSMEGKQRALQAYATKSFRRICTEYLCCLHLIFKKRKIMN